MDTRQLIADLQRPEAYPHAVGRVDLIQTHISLLFFAGDRVYKVKKPVDLGFLDFTRPEARRRACEDEVRLNRRLAPRTYLGVSTIRRGPGGRLHLHAAGEPVDWAVEMLRLPEDRMLANLLDKGEVDNREMDALAHLLADFHAAVPTGPGVDEHGSPRNLRSNIEENFTQLREFTGAVEDPRSCLSSGMLDFLRGRALGFVQDRHELLERRMGDGRIREGHGDLHAGNICLLKDRAVIYDCIEFNRRFRCGDVANDLAFLAMDLDFRGYAAFGRYMVQRYAEITGDRELQELMPFYKGYRAVVRGKVAALTAQDPDVEDGRRAGLLARSRRYLELAAGYELPLVIILMCGEVGTGKTSAAEAFARPLNAALLHSDVTRKMLAGVPIRRRPEPGDLQRVYSREMTSRTYDLLLRRAKEAVEDGRSVVVDATFSTRELRRPFLDWAAGTGRPFLVAHVTAPEAVIRERLERRSRDPDAVSDAGAGVYEQLRGRFQEPDELPPDRVLALDSASLTPDAMAAVLMERLMTLAGDGV